MAYNITLTNGQNLVTVADGTTDTNYTSLTLIGKNFAGYGQFLNENFVKLLENFANNSAPVNPLQGQIWWDSTNKLMKVYNGTAWKTVSSSTASATQPALGITGDLWWDTANGQLKVYSGSTWVVIGPAYTATQGQSGAIADVVAGSVDGLSHVIVKFYISNTLVAVLSKDSPFTVSSLPGFTTINPGFTMAAISPTPGYYGDSQNALSLGGVLAANYLRNDVAGTINNSLAINSNTGLTVGAGSDLNIGVASGAINFNSTQTGRDVNFYLNLGGVQTKMLGLTTAGTGGVTVASDPTTALGVATKGYVDSVLGGSGSSVLRRDGGTTITGNIVPNVTNVNNFGSSVAKFNTIYATTFNGQATDAAALGGVAANLFVRTDQASASTAPLTINNNTGLTIGTNNDFQISVASSPNAVRLSGKTVGKGMYVDVTTASGLTTALSISGTTGMVEVLGVPTTALGVATKGYVDSAISSGSSLPTNLLKTDGSNQITGTIVPNVNNSLSFGSSTNRFATVFATTFNGTAMTAQYADLAERFEADTTYLPGTVVELGGAAEVTAAMDDLSENVFGVISTQAAYLMNAGAGNDATHPPIAMQGRVPVRVIGKIKKGDRLVSAGNGLGRAASKVEITPFNVIGRALADKLSDGEGTVEAIVKLNS